MKEGYCLSMTSAFGQVFWKCRFVKGGGWGAWVFLVQWVPFDRRLMSLGLQIQIILSQEEQQVCSTRRKAKDSMTSWDSQILFVLQNILFWLIISQFSADISVLTLLVTGFQLNAQTMQNYNRSFLREKLWILAQPSLTYKMEKK